METSDLITLINKIPGRSPLELTPINIQDYCCGSYDLISRDLSIVLPNDMIEYINELIQPDLTASYRLREELINMKKLAYHIYHTGTSIERGLAQLATFFREDHINNNDINRKHCWVHSERFTTIADARMRCKGACAAVSDARSIAKVICCLPRHPAKGRPSALDRPLETTSLVRNARDTISKIKAEGVESLDISSGNDDLGNCNDVNSHEVVTASHDSNESVSEVTWSTRMKEHISSLPSKDSRFSEEVVDFVSRIVICRGGDKALRMVDEVNSARTAVRNTISSLTDTLPVLREFEEKSATRVANILANVNSLEGHVDTQVEVGRERTRGIQLHRHINLLSGALPPLQALSEWLEDIYDIALSRSNRMIFLAGDSSADRHSLPPALHLPASSSATESMSLFASYRAIENTYRPQMRDTISCSGWPASISLGSLVDKSDMKNCPNNKFCRVCCRVFTPLWVHCGICCECEDKIRTQGRRCPYREQCQVDWFCPHALKCLICDAHSCDMCGLHRGDADTVIEIANRVKPRRIALDFDRTVSSTRSGAKPIVGRHTVDVDLISLMWQHPCAIVTRNQNHNEIRSFLSAQGAPPDLEICTVKKKESKAGYVFGSTAEGCSFPRSSGGNRDSSWSGTSNARPVGSDRDSVDHCSNSVLFVDDSIQELVGNISDLSNGSVLHRVLFVRGLA